jgi:hypothetical protein
VVPFRFDGSMAAGMACGCGARRCLKGLRIDFWFVPNVWAAISSVYSRAMRILSAGHAAFAATIIELGIMGLVKGAFSPIREPLPKGVPAREVLV